MRVLFLLANATNLIDYGPGPGEAVELAIEPVDLSPGPGERVPRNGRLAGFRHDGVGRKRKPRSKPAPPAPDDIIDPPKKKRAGRPRPTNVLGHGLDKRLAERSRIHRGEIPPREAAWECACQVIKDNLPQWQRGGRTLTAAMFQHLKDETAAHLKQRDLCPDLPEERVAFLAHWAVRWAIIRHDERRAAADVWHGPRDKAAGRAMLTGMASNELLAEVAAKAKRNGFKLNRHQVLNALLIVWLAAAKSILTQDEGAVPVKCLTGALRYYGYKQREDRLRRLVPILRGTLEELGLIVCTDPRHWCRRSRRYAIAGATHKLPFVITAMAQIQRHQHAALMVEVKEQNAATRAALAKQAERLSDITDSAFSTVLVHCFTSPTTHPTRNHGQRQAMTTPTLPFSHQTDTFRLN